MSDSAGYTPKDPNVKLFGLGDFELLSGEVIPNAHIAYRTYGDASKPAIVYPTWYSGTITDGNEWLIALPGSQPETRSLDPSRFFIIVPALFGNGESSSPSNHPLGAALPRATFYDNVRAQHKLVYEHLGVQGKVVVIGWSQGFRNHLCRWGFSQAFYREGMFKRHFGLDGASNVLSNFWHAWATSKDANNLLYMIHTWQHGDIGAQPKYAGASKRDVPQSKGGRLGTRGDGGAVTDDDDQAFNRALKAIQCPTMIVPAKTDLYFPPEDSEEEARIMGDTAALEVIPTIWGHWAGGPGDSKDDVKWLDDKIYAFFQKHGILD
ncbi:hypothetical protein L1887_57001 [Cichorium endivia]|nr:hypothetical protein L1887_57001 [Cichorium endivia]